MNAVICGAGQVGSFTAESLIASGHRVTVIDMDARRLSELGETLDLRTVEGDASHVDVLERAGTADADLFFAATADDKVNLLSASIARGVGAKRAIVRVHAREYFERGSFDLKAHLGIDRIISPEHAAARAIARSLRNPGAHAMETFARGRIEMQEVTVSPNAEAIGVPLNRLGLPAGTRVVSLKRQNLVSLPEASTQAQAGDVLTLIANADVFAEARKKFKGEKPSRMRVVVFGGDETAVWLCREIRDRSFSVRVFETDRSRAEELAEEMSWVTVVNADPTDPTIFSEEGISDADVFVAARDDDEDNIVSSSFAKNQGVPRAIAVVQKRRFARLLEGMGVDRVVSPKREAAREISELLDRSPIRRLASVAEGILEVFEVRVGEKSRLAGVPLREITDFPNWILAGVEHEGEVFVPGPDLAFQSGDTLLVVGPRALERSLREHICA